MKLFVKDQRNGGLVYSSHDGMDEETVTRLLTELGATEIEFITEEDYMAATQVTP